MDAIEIFPRGLKQPEGSFRFGQDALLLAALTARFCTRKDKVVELGCGCGAALSGLLLLWPCAYGLGLDIGEELLKAARENALSLNLAGRTEFACADFTGKTRAEAIAKNAAGFDVAIANPPWQIMGRPARTVLREQALRSPAMNIFEAFFQTAHFLLRAKGHFYLILPARSIGELFFALEKTGFGLRFLQPLKTSSRASICMRIFVLCQKSAQNDPQFFAQLNVGPGNPGAEGDWMGRVFTIQQ